MKIEKAIAAVLVMGLPYAGANAQWSLSGNAGTNAAIHYVGTSDNKTLTFRTFGAIRMVVGTTGTISVGTTVSPLAKFTTTGAVGNTTAIFGTSTTGVSLQQSYPGISFNSYYNAGFKALAAGYGANITLDPTNGKIHFRTVGNGAAAGSPQTYQTPMVITNSGSVGINNMNPAASVDLQIGTSTGARLQIGDQSQLVDMGNMLLDVSSTFRPTADNAYHLGASQNRWVDVWSADGSINTSDRRDKTNIREIGYGLGEVMKLHPVIFNWKDAPERGDRIGLIAQELQTVIKEAVVTKTYTTAPDGTRLVTENERLGVFYSDLVPVVIKAIQEQQQQINDRDATIIALESELKNLQERLGLLEQMIKSVTNNAFLTKDAQLYQNTPNPFSDKSLVRFFVPAKASNAVLKIYSSDGKEIKSFRTNTKGENKIEIAAGSLPAGIYNYSLFIDGKVAASKQMVLVQ